VLFPVCFGSAGDESSFFVCLLLTNAPGQMEEKKKKKDKRERAVRVIEAAAVETRCKNQRGNESLAPVLETNHYPTDYHLKPF